MFRLGLFSVILLAPVPAGYASHLPAAPFTFRRDGVLGTSLDLTFVAGSRAEAARAEAVAVAEIERLRRLVSTWDATSEASRLQAAGRLDHSSPELRELLAEYQRWTSRTGGAYTSQIGAFTAVWKNAEQSGRIPEQDVLDALVADVRRPAWSVDTRSTAITMLRPARLDLNSLGKGFILDRVVRLVREEVPGVRGGLVNIGGDIRTWGDAPSGGSTWRVGVTDPRRSADNAPPLTEVTVGDAAVSTSGGYARGFSVAGQHFSHIIDPRTGLPVNRVLGVTVIAPDNATANALATSLSVLDPLEGLALVQSLPGVECLLVTSTGDVVRSPGFARFESPAKARAAAASAREIHATMAIDVTPTNWNRHRPYVAAWVTDTTGKHIRTLALWGDRPKYLRELSKWWLIGGNSRELVDAVARATRPAGKYTLEWDGLDQAGAAVLPGVYQFWLEVAFENGAHSLRSVNLTCSETPATATLAPADAFAGAQVDCVVKK